MADCSLRKAIIDPTVLQSISTDMLISLTVCIFIYFVGNRRKGDPDQKLNL